LLLDFISPVVLTNGDSTFLNFDLFQMAFLWFNVAVIVFILNLLLNKPIKEFLEKRRERIAAEIEKAASDMKVAEEKRSQYEGKLVAINNERDEILAEARKLAQEKEAEIIQIANAEARQVMDRAKAAVELEKEKAKDEMRTQIIQVSALMAEQLLGRGMDENDKEKILNDAINELGDAVWKG
jgi:F-type H+-transporting ATPase subunit b